MSGPTPSRCVSRKDQVVPLHVGLVQAKRTEVAYAWPCTWYLAIVVCPTSMPSLSNSPWMRGAPQSGLADPGPAHVVPLALSKWICWSTQNTFDECLRNTPPITMRYGLTFHSGRMRPHARDRAVRRRCRPSDRRTIYARVFEKVSFDPYDDRHRRPADNLRKVTVPCDC